MKINEILARTKVGAIVTDKRVLSGMKYRGLIFGYSQWGYLESAKMGYKDSDGYRDAYYCELFPKGNAPKEYDTEFDSIADVFAHIGKGGEIEYKGCKFRTKYLDGCFNPYLQLVEKCGCREVEVNPRMSLWGKVI